MLESFVEEDPSDPFNYYALAMELRHKDKAKSIQLLHQIIIDFPDYLPSYFQLASFYLDDDMRTEAAELIKKAIQLAINQKNQKTLAELRQLLSSLENE